MEFNRKQLSSILGVLRESPRGMNVTEVAKETGMNRSTVAKYLEMLFVSGHVDMRSFGTSKVYYISQRMPISAFLNFTSDLIIVLDKYSRVLNANDAFFEFTDTCREDIVHKNMDNFAFPLKFDPSIEPYILKAVQGTATTIESYYRKDIKGYCFNVKLIPLVFDDGEKGVTVIFEDITDKKLAEKALRDSNVELERKVRERTLELEKVNEALRKSEAYLLEAQQIAHLGNWSFNLKTKDIRVSDETNRMFKAEPGYVWTYDFFKSRIHPDDMALVEETDRDAVTLGKPINFEYRILLPDGSMRFIHSIGEVRRDASGDAVEIFGTLQDITERKRAEEALHDSEEKFRALADSSKIGILLIQGEDIIYGNQALADMFGYTVGEVLKMKYWDTALPEMKDYIRQRITLRQRGEPGPSRTELKMVKSNGEFIWLDCTAAVLQYRGKPAIMLTTMDITARNMMERELRISEERYRSLFEKKHDLAWETDVNNLCTYMSPRAKDIIGYEQEELLGKTPFEKMTPEEVMRIMAQAMPMLEKHEPFELLDYFMIKKDGNKAYFNTFAVPIFDEQGEFKGYRGVCKDITNERK